ncbi:HAD family hydrolase [Bacillus sp. BRMEA1]|uniref:HAD family hydrolase n=1 Tax=Neobacillus endophyticus TaxID=2738405 RepID=UPI0015643271|nr:HAD family hydrolase [Neobacillus endophyticus]NRD77853.1 HAD family hydrolase [Neobacillus endophyticus]
MLKDIEVIVFDLDGTLYEDTHHFDFYADRLCEKLAPTNKEHFYKDYQLVKENKHPLKIGTVYDANHDFILIQQNGKVLRAVNWEGEKISDNVVKELYPGELKFNLHSLFSVGDFWWVPASIARHYGLSGVSANQSFLQTREYMMSADFQMKEIPSFKDTLFSLSKRKKLVLYTNSPQKDSEVIAKKLGFLECFDYKIFEGQKPVRTEENFIKIKDHYQLPFSKMLSIGDNAINEIIPAKKLGCKTIQIDAHEIGDQAHADYVVKNIAGVVELLKKM